MATASPKMTKGVFLEALECETRGWFVMSADPGAPSAGDQMRMEEGQEIHRRARGLYAQGVFAGNVKATQAILAAGTAKVIFEAAFEADGFAARADMIVPKAKGIHLVEVKSSLHDDEEVKDELIDDLAFTAMVLRKAGLRIVKAELLLLSRDWRLGMPDSAMFVGTDHTKLVLARADEFEKLSASVAKAVLSKKSPAAAPILACKNCGYFEDDCVGKGLEDPIFDLPRLSPKKFAALKDEAVLTIEGIPLDFDLTDNQERVRRSVVSGKPWCDRKVLRDLLAEVEWPAVYLDFETVKTALPLWPNIAPHEQVVTQYSIHVCDHLGKVKHHREYLADAKGDRRRELAERLIADAEGQGSIIAYHAAFEKTVIADLAERFPDLRKPLRGLLDRVFDLERVFTKAYYHPAFRGSSSIKVVLPVLIPSMGYDGLEIGDGDSAIVAFARMASGMCSAKEEATLRKGLLDYCRQDTLAMVKLHEKVGCL
ncbi:MAG: DUF2779 domain-containing protein [Phycisphaerales bacterium]